MTMELTSLSPPQSATPRPSKSDYASASNVVACETSLVGLPEPDEQSPGGSAAQWYHINVGDPLLDAWHAGNDIVI